MVEKNKVYEMEISSYGSDGEGVGKVDDFVVFVPYTARGDRILVKIVKVAKHHAFGKLERILQSSPARVEPSCAAFGKCGGCSIMHLNYEEQLWLKREKVSGCLRRIGGCQTPVEPVLGSKNTFHYRNKVQIPVGRRDERIVAGFYAPHSHRIVPHESCVIEPEAVDEIVSCVRTHMERFSIEPYDEKTKRGQMRTIYVRSAKSGERMVVLVTKTAALPGKERLIEDLKGLGVVTLVQNIHPQPTNVVLGKEYRVLYGDGFLYDTIGQMRFQISPDAFFQVNARQTERLYETAIALAEISKEDTVFDLYCGIGTISLYAAKWAKQVVGIELVESAVANAKENARRNQVDNVRFYCGDAGEITGRLQSKGVKADIAIVDPPRKGCSEELLQLLRDMNPKRVVYVSCNPATLARDVKILMEYGFEVKKVQPVDMFCHSAHVETVALLQRRDT